MHGSGTYENKSGSRIILGFNSYWKNFVNEVGH